MQPPAPAKPPHPTPVSAQWSTIGLFTAAACGLAWLIASPLWFMDLSLESPWFGVCAAAMMFTPALATLIAWQVAKSRTPQGSTPTTFTALCALWPIRPNRSFFAAMGLAWVGPLLLSWMALGAGSLFGTAHFSPNAVVEAITETLQKQGVPEADLVAAQSALDQVPGGLLLLVLSLQTLLGALINTIFAAGEEIGWRGYLHPALRRRMGWLGAVGVGGIIWGLWHAPLILLGYNYERTDGLGLVFMCAFCVLIGALLAALRDVTGSVWPAALAHGAINAAAPLPLLIADHNSAVTSGSLLGWPGWLVLVIALVGVLAWRGIPPRSATPPSTPTAETNAA